MLQSKCLNFTVFVIISLVLKYIVTDTYAIEINENILKESSRAADIRHLHKRNVIAPIQLYAQSGSIHSIWNTNVGGNSSEAREDTSGIGFYAIGQSADNLFDNNLNTAYTSRGNASCENTEAAGIHTGFYFNVAQCQAELTGFQICTSANADRSQDPLGVSIEGSNDGGGDLTAGSNWQSIYLGTTGLNNITTAATCGTLQQVTVLTNYKSYRFLITSKRNLTNYVSYSEVKLFGYSDRNIPNVNVNSLDIAVVKSDRIDYAAFYTCAVSKLTVTTFNMSIVDNLCSTNQLNVNAYDNSTVTLKSSSCADTINIFTNASAVVNNICANNQAYILTKSKSKINFNPSIKCSNIVYATVTDTSTVNNICANNQLNILSTEDSLTNMNLSLVYPKTLNVTTFATSKVLNIFANETMYVQAKEGSYVTTKESPCPVTASITATGGHVYNLCASNYANLYASYGSNVVMQNSSCPPVANAFVEYGGKIYVCATQTINAVALTGGTIYYRGTLNSSFTNTSGQIIPM